MSQLLVVAYPAPRRAAEVLAALRRLHLGSLADLDSAVYVTREVDGGIELHQTVSLAGTDAAGKAFWGLLIGLLISAPLLGGIVGPAADVVGGSLADLGIDERFVDELGTALGPGGSAIFALVRDARLDAVATELSRHGGAQLRTPVSRRATARLRAAVRGGWRA